MNYAVCWHHISKYGKGNICLHNKDGTYIEASTPEEAVGEVCKRVGIQPHDCQVYIPTSLPQDNPPVYTGKKFAERERQKASGMDMEVNVTCRV